MCACVCLCVCMYVYVALGRLSSARLINMIYYIIQNNIYLCVYICVRGVCVCVCVCVCL